MGWSRVALVERRVLRTPAWSRWMLVGVIALGSGAAMGAVAGGRRAATSYDRLVTWTDGGDAVYAFGYGPDSAEADALMTEVAALPSVAASSRDLNVSSEVTVRGEPLPFLTAVVLAVDLESTTAGRVKVIAGDLPADDASRGVVDFATAERLDLGVGDAVEFVPSGASSGAPSTVTIAAIIATPGAFPTLADAPGNNILVPDALLEERPELVDWSNAALVLKLREGATEADLLAEFDRAGIAGFVFTLSDQAVGVRRLMRVEAGILWFFAAVVAAAGAIVIAQFLRRGLAARSAELALCGALGLGRRAALAAGALHGARAGAIGALIGAVGAIGVSPVFPVGVARTADPNPGLHADLVVLCVGVVTTIVMCCAAAVLGVASALRRAPRRDARRRSLITFATSATRPSLATGTRLALAPARGASAIAPSLGIAGVASTLTIIVATLAAGANVGRLVADPALSGGAWDLTLSYDSPEDGLAAGAAIARDPGVLASARGGWVNVEVNGRPVHVAFVEAGRGIAPATARGRAPIEAAEIALGAAELAALDVRMGDTVEISLGSDDAQSPTHLDAVVTGESVLMAPATITLGQGGGGVVTLATMERLGYPMVEQSHFVRLRLQNGALRDAAKAVADRAAPSFWFVRGEPSSVGVLRDLGTMRVALVALLSTIAVVVVLQRLLAGSQAHRRRLALLRALGFTDAQVRRSGVFHGAIVTGLGALVGCVLGTIVAVFVWRRLADYLGVVPAFHATVLPVVVAVVGVLGLGVLTGVAAADRARRRPPGAVLRELT